MILIIFITCWLNAPNLVHMLPRLYTAITSRFPSSAALFSSTATASSSEPSAFQRRTMAVQEYVDVRLGGLDVLVGAATDDKVVYHLRQQGRHIFEELVSSLRQCQGTFCQGVPGYHTNGRWVRQNRPVTPMQHETHDNHVDSTRERMVLISKTTCTRRRGNGAFPTYLLVRDAGIGERRPLIACFSLYR